MNCNIRKYTMINVKDNKCKHKNLKQNHHITDMIPKMPKMIHQDGSQMTMMTPQMTKMIHQDGPKMIPRGTGPSATQDRNSKTGGGGGLCTTPP